MVLTWLERVVHGVRMFERFTKPARRVVVHAQDEARALGHNFIGTEHLLLGLLDEPDSIAALALARFGLSLDAARDEVAARIGAGKDPVKGRIPFTPRAKKVLELGLREALQLHHNYIGTEHLLLGMVREADGVGAQIIREHAGDLLRVRMAVLDLLPAVQATPSRRWLRRRTTVPAEELAAFGEAGPPEEPEELPTTPAADASLAEAARLAGSQPVGSHHLLLATLADSGNAAAKALAGLGVDLDQAREALRHTDITGTSDEQPEERGRRHMLIRATESLLTIDVTDQTIVDLGRDALKALGDRAVPSGTIPGDLPIAASLGGVWQALRDSLEDIRRRAMDPGDAGAVGTQPGPATPPDPPNRPS
jgi:ATP-dependent Clp protease ATP-binding subunit ClpA